MVWWWVAVLCAALLQAHAAAPHGVDGRGLSQRLLQRTTALSPCALGRVLGRRGGRMRLEGGGSGKKGAPEAAALITEHQEDEVVHLEDVYHLGAVLGQGGFAKVIKGTHRITGNHVAIKSIDLCKIQADKLEMLINEIEVMKMLDHPNIVRLYETFSDKPNSKLHLVMELCEGGDLLDFLLKTEITEDGKKLWSDPTSKSAATFFFSERHVSSLAAKMMSALQYLHSKNIAHRDIKPENFMLEAKAENLDGSPFQGGEVKMIDFGFSKMFQGTEEMHQCLGSPYYVAPEVIDASQGYGRKCDLWSLGVVVYMMLVGSPPFDGGEDEDLPTMWASIKKGVYTWPEEVGVTEEAKDLVSKLLVVDPSKRASASQALSHPWILRALGHLPAQDEDQGAGSNLNLEDVRKNGVARWSRLLSRMGKARNMNALKRQALLAIGYNLDRLSIRSMRETFRALDVEGHGRIRARDLKAAMLRYNIPEEAVQSVFESFKGDTGESAGGTGESARGGEVEEVEIEYTSFLAACLDKRNYHEQLQLFQAFHRFQDESGAITVESLQKMLNLTLSHEEAQALVREADLKGDNKLSWGEFCLMMSHRLPVARVAWRQVPLFHELSADEVAQILHLGSKHRWEEGEELISAHEKVESLILIEEGEVEIIVPRGADVALPSIDASQIKVGRGLEDGNEAEAEAEARHVFEAQDDLEAQVGWDGDQRDGEERDVVVLLAARNMVGELAFASPDKVSHVTVSATRTVVGHTIRFDHLSALLARDVSLGSKVWKNIARITAIRLQRMNKIYSDSAAALSLYANARKSQKSQ